MSHTVDAYRGNGETVVVMDDVSEQRDIARRMLTQLGYQVHTVDSGENAIVYMQHHHADLILLDMNMEPGMSGLNTYQRIVNLHPGQRAVITSGYSRNKKVAQTQELGAGSYLKKPYTMETLGMAVKKELQRPKRSRERVAQQD